MSFKNLKVRHKLIIILLLFTVIPATALLIQAYIASGKIEQAVIAQLSHSGASVQSIHAEIVRAQYEMFAGATIQVLLSLVFSYWIGRAAARPLVATTETLQRLANHDTGVEIIGTDAKDEFGDIARTQQVFKENLQQMKRMEAEQKAAGIHAAEERRRSMNELAGGFESSVGQIVALVSSAATELNASAENLSAIAD